MRGEFRNRVGPGAGDGGEIRLADVVGWDGGRHEGDDDGCRGDLGRWGRLSGLRLRWGLRGLICGPSGFSGRFGGWGELFGAEEFEVGEFDLASGEGLA